MTIGNIRSVKVAAICVALLVSACAESDLFSPYAAPGKYDFLDCPSIADRIKSTTNREQQLIELMSRAKESTTGPIVNAMAYQDDLNTARANLRELRKAAKPRNAPGRPLARGNKYRRVGVTPNSVIHTCIIFGPGQSMVVDASLDEVARKLSE